MAAFDTWKLTLPFESGREWSIVEKLQAQMTSEQFGFPSIRSVAESLVRCRSKPLVFVGEPDLHQYLYLVPIP